jgi:hypothetical protein
LFRETTEFLFQILNRNKVEPKQTKTGQEEDQQGKKGKSGRSKAKKVKQRKKKN